jgi:uncharacterized lipoprotein
MRSVLGLVCAALLCSGCALTTATIDVPYQQAAAPAAPAAGAAGTSVSVAATDSRTTYRDRVSTKKNGYGMEMAAIVPSNDLPATVRDAFSQELTARGFKLGQGGAAMTIELVRFYNDFKTGFFSGDAVATVAFNVKITGPGGASVFSKYYEGSGTEPNIQLAGGSNARAALIKAFQTSVASAVNDPDLIHALVATGSHGVALLAPAATM